MENDPRIVELLAEMAFKLDKLDGLASDVKTLTQNVHTLTDNVNTLTSNVNALTNDVNALTNDVNALTNDVRDMKQSLARQETLFTRHLETTEAQQNSDIVELRQRVTVLERKVA
jgi:X-X-X-Leu-X-X-Gly heptad repeat protein